MISAVVSQEENVHNLDKAMKICIFLLVLIKIER